MTQAAIIDTGPYKGYRGRAEFDADAGRYHGEVTNTRDVITFIGASPPEVEKEFKVSVDGYLEFCASRGEEPAATWEPVP